MLHISQLKNDQQKLADRYPAHVSESQPQSLLKHNAYNLLNSPATNYLLEKVFLVGKTKYCFSLKVQVILRAKSV